MSYPYYQNSHESSQPPSAAARAFARFAQSPLNVFAILAYTCYTVIATIQSLPMLEYLDDCFDLIEYSFPYFLTMLSTLLLFVAPIIITCGLWSMYASGGKNGGGAVRGGIATYVTLSATIVVCALWVFFEENSYILEYMDMSEVLGELFFPVSFFIFNMVASATMCGFANAVEYTAYYGKPSVDGVAKAGILILIACFVNLLAYFGVFESVDSGAIIDSLDSGDEAMANVAQISHYAAYLLFGFAALNYSSTVGQASSEDFAHEQRDFMKAMTPSGETWRCSCGRVNAIYCSSCVCGATKHSQTTRPATQPTYRSTHTTTQANPASDYIFCDKCGGKNAAKAKFCGTCGNKLIN